MAKTIHFNYDGKDYTLEFSRESVSTMERQGFLVNELTEKPGTYILQFFAGSFLMHHASIKRSKIEEIYSHISDKQGLLDRLAEMYDETITSLVDEPEDDDQGKIKWETSW